MIITNFVALNQAAAGLGHINSDPDRDGVYRRVSLFITTPDLRGTYHAVSRKHLPRYLAVFC